MRLTTSVAQSFQVAKVFDENKARINAIDFSLSGELLITSSDDDSIQLYNPVDGTHQRTLYSKKYGVSQIRFTHGGTTVVHASTKENDTIRYLSLHDNKYVRYFQGHKKRVTSIDVSPSDDTFLSASTDGTVRLWDVRSSNCQGVVHCGEGLTVASFGSDGLVFAIGVNRTTICMYDSRQYEKGPFSKIECAQNPWIGMKFSPDGRTLMFNDMHGYINLYDAFSYVKKCAIYVGGNIDTADAEVSFTPDSRYIMAGTVDNSIKMWHVDDGAELATLLGHNDFVGPVKFNPRYMSFASADTTLALWMPSTDDTF